MRRLPPRVTRSPEASSAAAGGRRELSIDDGLWSLGDRDSTLYLSQRHLCRCDVDACAVCREPTLPACELHAPAELDELPRQIDLHRRRLRVNALNLGRYASGAARPGDVRHVVEPKIDSRTGDGQTPFCKRDL